MAWMEARGWGSFEVELLPQEREKDSVERLEYSALPDTGSPVTVIPGRVVGKPMRPDEFGYIEVVDRFGMRHERRDPLVDNGDFIKIRTLGDRENRRHYFIFRVQLKIDRNRPVGADAIFMWPDEDWDRSHIILGRSFLFKEGGCCFHEYDDNDDRKGFKRFRRRLCSIRSWIDKIKLR